MQLGFYGAARTVTGSCYLLEAGGLRLLVDCGLFQGRDEELNRQPLPFDPAGIDHVILTHAHLDHVGRLPMLSRRGFAGTVITQTASTDLAAIMLMDAAHIQEQDARWRNKRERRRGVPETPPLYTVKDVDQILPRFRSVPYSRPVPLGDTVSVRFLNAGHILGAAMVEISVAGGGRLLFSGDIGRDDQPILRDPSRPGTADYVVMESTYGDRHHTPAGDTARELAAIIRETAARGGNVIIPAFAVGRTQELLYLLNELAESEQIPRLPIVLDSPMAIRVTELTRQHSQLFDKAARELIRQGDEPFSFPGLHFALTVEDSKRLNSDPRSKVIMAGSGMCTGGRVVHHLKHNLWRAESTVLFVGYQAEGTLGREILDGAEVVQVLGEEIAVKARIARLEGLSAHADQAGLLRWAAAFSPRPRRIFLTHGEPDAQHVLAGLLTEQGHQVTIPGLGDRYSL